MICHGVVALATLHCAADAGAAKPRPGGNPPPTILMDGDLLAANKPRILAGHADLHTAFTNLIALAEAALYTNVVSVTDKTRIPASGDKHDYSSYARYWWPDPGQPGGKPYVKRDGETNPETVDPASTDRYRMDLMANSVETLGIAYYLTGKERYADKAADFLRAWFLNPDTRMNPNMNHAQAIPGILSGSKHGIIDARVLICALDGALLISTSPALSADEMQGLRDWSARYLTWLKTSKLALEIADKPNNHSIFFDVQRLYFALFSGDRDYARNIAEQAVDSRIMKQVAPDGSMPEELLRTRSLHYSIFAVQALFELARLADQVDVDLWHAAGSRIKTALDYLTPYADPERTWPRREIKPADRTDLLGILLYGAHVYQDEAYRKMAEKLPAASKRLKENLVVPLSR